MTKMTRYETKTEEGTYYVEVPDGWLVVGPIDGIVELLGGEEYMLEYTSKQASVSWLNTDNDATITVCVREWLESMSFTEDIVNNLVNCPLDKEGDEGYPMRTELFADLMEETLKRKGNVEL